MIDLAPRGACALLVLSLACGCGAEDAPACTGGPVAGAPDRHCEEGAARLVAVDRGQCGAAAAPDVEYGATMYGTAGRDDDCKYALAYTVEPICRDAGASFVLTVTAAVDGAPVTMAGPRAEVFLDDVHPAPNSGATSVETSPGVYRVGPIVFDAAGTWTVRFHVFEDCADTATSPHGHGAFFVQVP